MEEREISKILFIRKEKLLVRVDMEKLLFVKSEGNYLQLHFAHDKYLLREKLGAFLATLPASSFIRVHRRFVVNLQKIEIIGSGFLTLIGHEIPVSATYKDALMERVEII